MKRLILAALIILAALNIAAQRRVSPVNNAATATQPVNKNKVEGDTIDLSRYIEKLDGHGNTILVDTITGKEFVDSTKINQSRVPRMEYPLLYKASVYVDVFQPVMRALGQKYGLVEFGAEVNLHNRYIPVVEVGLGQARNAPADNNYTYRSPVAPYFRIGINYNFLYNSNPDYMVFAGLRYGLSPFRFSVDNVTMPGGYWDEPADFDIPAQSVTAGYIQLLFGLRVNIRGNLSLGWTVNYHAMLHESKTAYGEPWYIPGFGTRGSSLGAQFLVTYSFGLPQRHVRDTATELSPLPEPIGTTEEEHHDTQTE